MELQKNISTVLGQIVYAIFAFRVGLSECVAYGTWNEVNSIFERSTVFFWSGFGALLLGITEGTTTYTRRISEYSSHNDSLKPFDHQVAGHKHSYPGQDTEIGMMKESDGEYEYLLKPAIHPVYGPREINFYEELVRTTQDLELEELKEYIPKYNGTTTVVLGDRNITFIRLEDLTTHFKLPCVMDLKIGQKTWEPDASISKILEQSFISPFMKIIWSFSVNGLKYYDVEKRVSVIHDKAYYTKRVFFYEIVEEMYNFLNGEFGVECGLVDAISEQLERIRSWFQRQKRFLFLGSSILFAYDAECFRNKTRGGDADDEYIVHNNRRPHRTEIRIRMIDFAHTIPSTKNEVDFNYLESLENLIYVFENLTTLYADTQRNGMMTRIIRGFSFDEILRQLKRIFGIRK